MRAEARGDGELGMLFVGNAGVNSALADYLDSQNNPMLEQMVYQNPGRSDATKMLFLSTCTT